MHKLLKRQLKKCLGVNDLQELQHALEAGQLDLSDKLENFFERISSSYEQFERDLTLRARSLELSSEELTDANVKIKQEAEIQGQVIETLRYTINQMLVSEGKEPLSEEITAISKLSEIISNLVEERSAVRKSLDNQKFALDQHAIVSVTDKNSNIIYANEKFCETSEYTLPELLGKKHNIVNSGIHSNEFFRDLWRTITAGKVWHGEICNKSRTGKLYWVAATIVPLFEQDDTQPSSYIAIRTDISERKEIEKQLKEAINVAEAANKAKSEFLATMSHEIRTPMNGVIGMTGLLMETKLDHQQTHYAETIKASGEALLNIINDILDYSKMEAGKLHLEQEHYNLNELISGIIELMGTRAREKDIELAYFIEPDLMGIYEGDSGRIRQILLNLIGNAIKFTNKGGVTLHVTQNEKDHLLFTIKDTGIGINEEDQHKLFSSFSQVDTSIARKFGGTGLGLAICKRIVSLMGGEIGVKSQDGLGSTFWFGIPMQRIADKEIETYVPNVRSLRALILDDNKINLEIFQHQLRSWSIQSDTATNVHEALKYLETNSYDFALIDMQMPGISGYVFVTAVRNMPEHSQMKLIMASSINKSELEQKYQLSMLDAFLMKPVHQSQLYNSILETCGLKVRKETQVQEIKQSAFQTSNTSLRVLIAEDNWVNQEVVCGYLKKMGHSADVAGNGLEALEALKQRPYDLILMDVQMPEMDGLTASREIRKLAPPLCDIPIIAVTANAMRGDAEKCFKAGMNRYLSKPIDKIELQECIAEMMALDLVHDQRNEDPILSLNATTSPFEDCVNLGTLISLAEDLELAQTQMLLDNFINNLPERIIDIRSAIETADHDALKKAAHSLKGVSLTLGFKQLSELAQRLEQNATLAGKTELIAIYSELETAEQNAKDISPNIPAEIEKHLAEA